LAEPQLNIAMTQRRHGLFRAGLAEFVGTFFFVLLGMGTVVATGQLDSGMTAGRLVAVALGVGLSLGLVVAAVGGVSGGHINPAVTLASLIEGRINLVTAQLYFAAQLSGAIFGAILLAVIAPGGDTLASTRLGEDVGPFAGVFLEMVLTFALVLTVLKVSDKTHPSVAAPIAIGLVVMLDHLVGVPLTGASLNPARSFGPALVSGTWADHWVYWIGPLAGGALAALFHTHVDMIGEDQRLEER
jgi:aquaporin TIP